MGLPRPAGPGVLIEHASPVERVVLVLVGLDHLQVVDVHKQEGEEQQAGSGDPAQRSVHCFITCVGASATAGAGIGAGALAALLMRSSNATSAQLATSDDPP